ncbi:serine/threonine-protein kinase [Streptomyces sp. NPDC058157]|uniref:serine/threonine-protein kinase n=1 Tax=Streptomyces sp. NPDC058157 TaxID=3346360 RepID=UPI0036E14E06
MEGQLLGGRYRIACRLGEGGMGQVWEALDESLDRPVAVKVISLLAGGGTRGQDARARFLREARITARLQQANIVTIHDLGELGEAEERAPFLVMELIRGEGLDEVLRRGTVPPALVARWSSQICDALAAAHDAGIMHRDIKPSNILLTPSGTVKVLDFGIARAADPAVTGDRLTQTGFIVGTPPYMAPEQARGFPEPSSDLYALGCLIFELLTGRLPFESPDPVGYLSAHLTEEPPAPGSVSSDIPAAWDDLVLTLLRKEPARRYPDAAALARALRQLDLPPASAPPAPAAPVPAPPVPAPTASLTLANPDPPASAPADADAARHGAAMRFGLPAAVLLLTFGSLSDWFFSYGVLSFFINIGIPLVVLLGCAAALTPRSGILLRAVGYVAGAVAAAITVMYTLGRAGNGGLSHGEAFSYWTTIAAALATYVYREVTTRRRTKPTP